MQLYVKVEELRGFTSSYRDKELGFRSPEQIAAFQEAVKLVDVKNITPIRFEMDGTDLFVKSADCPSIDAAHDAGIEFVPIKLAL